jgi:hypothetical protein
MKPGLFIILFAILTLPHEALAQARDTTAAARTQEQQRERLRAGQSGFRDENGNGIDDRLERQVTGKGSKKDRFIDADGDGICDGRAGGLGFKRGNASGQQGTGSGKGTGTGNRYGQGGKK